MYGSDDCRDRSRISGRAGDMFSGSLTTLMIAPLRLAAVTAAALGCVVAASHGMFAASEAVPMNAADAVTAAAGPRTGSPAPGRESYPRESGGDDALCSFTAAPGYIEGGGGNSQVIQEDGHSSMGCGDGPNISLDHVDGDGSVTFSLHRERVRVREAATERLGPYRIHVVEIRGQRVEFEMSDPG
jgi:hypothetical protein